ncbi:hypothetical protein PCE1_002932 [Barthelona sp. PCE]
MPSSSKRRSARVKRVGSYLLGKIIGEGSFGKVRIATHIPTGARVALKVWEKRRIVDVADMERISREIHILKLLDHRNIVRLLEVINTPNHIYLVTEHAPGGELFDYIVARGRVKEKEACKFFHQIINGVDYCHQHGIIHRDLKPENLLLDEHKNIKMIDFGLSNTLKGDSLLTTCCGSPAYAAPEMIAGKPYTGPGVDIWSLGVILYALICGYLPFEDSNTSALYSKILSGRFTVPPHVTSSAKSLLKRMLVVNPERRATIEEIRQHPWYQLWQGSEEIYVRPRGIDNDCIAVLNDYGFDPEVARQTLEQGKHNAVTATYYLLLERKQKMEQKNEYSIDALRPKNKTNATVTEQAAPERKPKPSMEAISEVGPTAVSEKVPEKRPMQVPVRGKRRHSVAVGAGLDAIKAASNMQQKGEMPPMLMQPQVPSAAYRSKRRASLAPDLAALQQSKKEETEEGDEDLRVYRGAFSVGTTSSLPAGEVRAQLEHALQVLKLAHEPLGKWGFKVEDPRRAIRFEAEVCLLANFNSLRVICLKRVAGDTWSFRDLTRELLMHVKL